MASSTATTTAPLAPVVSGVAFQECNRRMLVLQGEGFVGRDMGRDDVAVAVADRALIRWGLLERSHTPVENSKPLLGEVIVNRHLVVPDDRDGPRLPRIEP